MSISRPFSRPVALLTSAVLAIPLALLTISPASAAVPTVGLGVLNDYSVLGGSAVTNTGPSVLNGSLGVSPGTAISGFDVPGGPGVVVGGTIYTPPAADSARAAAGTAYLDAAGRTGTSVSDVELGGKTLVAGVYTAGSTGTFGLTSTLTLTGDADDVWIFQTDTTLITAAASRVVLSGGAQACNVFWKVGSSASLGASSRFAGTILAAASITLDDNVNVVGRLIAGTGAVTLINDVITRPACATDGGTAAAAEAAAAAAAADAAAKAAEAVAAAKAAEESNAKAAADAAAAAAAAAQAASDEAALVVESLEPGTPEYDAAVTAAEEAAAAAVLAAEEAETAAEVAAEAAEEKAAAQAVLDEAAERAEILAIEALNIQPPAPIVVTPVNPAVPAPGPELAATGLADGSALLAAAGFILLLGAGLVALRLGRREVQQRKS